MLVCAVVQVAEVGDLLALDLLRCVGAEIACLVYVLTCCFGLVLVGVVGGVLCLYL